MPRQIVIDPVTRIEGHAKITIHVDDAGNVQDARFHVTEFRGFEKFCEGRTFREMPAITARICGICPVSHLMASAKAGDHLLAVEIPPAAVLLRRLMNLGQLVQSHALSFFHLSGPDLYLGFNADPAKRNVLGLMQAHPDLARRGIRLRKFGQDVIEKLGGKKIHPAWAVPGGVSDPMSAETRDAIRSAVPEALDTVRAVLDDFKKGIDRRKDEVDNIGDFPSLFLGLVTPTGGLEHYDGKIRVTDSSGAIVADMLEPTKYQEYIGEAVEPWSFLKFPYYRPMGYPGGIYRVGPLARLNVATHCGTPLADKELAEFRQHTQSLTSSFLYHYARLIEILFGVERIAQILDDPTSLDPNVRALATRSRGEGIGVSEAPRGTLFHHYKVKEGGILTWVNFIIATGQNNLPMNRTVLQIAKKYIRDNQVTDEALNRVEHGIRAFDPCLSCSTHALGQMPLHVQIVGPDDQILNEIWRGGSAG